MKFLLHTLSENKYYRKIIDLLANRKFADQKGIYKAVAAGKIKSQKGHPGGSFTLLLDDLESLGFISKYRPIETKPNTTGLVRYCISDEYLHFYFKFIVCEIKYYDGKVPLKIRTDVENKIALFINHNPKYKNYTFEKVLITTEGAHDSLKDIDFFDYIITFDVIFNPIYWN